MKVLLGIPTSGAPAQPFLNSLASLEIPQSVSSLEHYTVQGNFIAAQRELIVERALECNADVLVMCDDDMILPKDALALLLTVLENDSACGLVGALYYSRDGFRPMAVDDWSAENTTSASIPAFDRAPVRVGGVGFGCVAIPSSALNRLTAPYFETHVYVERTPPRVRVCNEDYLFCAALRAEGYDVILHAGLRCGHYDRHSQRIFPLQWEDGQITAQRRIAAVVDGKPALIPFSEIAGGRETHRSARLTYISPTE